MTKNAVTILTPYSVACAHDYTPSPAGVTLHTVKCGMCVMPGVYVVSLCFCLVVYVLIQNVTWKGVTCTAGMFTQYTPTKHAHYVMGYLFL